MEEELPLFIQESDEYSVFLTDNQEDQEVLDIEFIKYVPGARWMYLKYQGENFRLLILTYTFCFIFEVFSAVWNINKFENCLFFICTLTGISYFALCFKKSVFCEELLLNRFGYKPHLLSLIIAFTYWNCFKWFFLVALAGFGFILPVCLKYSKNYSFFVYINGALACFRISLAVVVSITHIIKLFSFIEREEIFVLNIIIAQISTIVSQDIHLGLACLLYFTHQYFYSEQQDKSPTVPIFLTLTTIMLICIFKLIN